MISHSTIVIAVISFIFGAISIICFDVFSLKNEKRKLRQWRDNAEILLDRLDKSPTKQFSSIITKVNKKIR